jgi:para-aminobenzoate synthetase component 1
MPKRPHHAAKFHSHTLAVAYRPGEQRFDAIAAKAGAVWLDSGNTSFSRGEFEIIASQPSRQVCIEADGRCQSAGGEPGTEDVFSLIQQLRRVGTGAYYGADSALPFHGGVLGYLGYDINRSLERIVAPAAAPGPLPLAWFGYYPWALVQNIQRQQAWLVADSEAALKTAQRYLATMDQGAAAPDQGAAAAADDFRLQQQWCATSSRQQYLDSVAIIQDFINAGDCYQVNLAQHFKAAYRGHPWHAYRRLRRRLPSPFSAFINTGDGCLLSHSPERFLRIDGRQIDTSPIKGTRARGQSAAADAALARELQQSAKDRAENLMIVDLLRNDLGKSCVAGSIVAEALFELESYANVHHLVSTISGRLRAEVSPVEALRNAFPGGSITGAPKIRAMDIINELEPVARSAYCGSVFYYSNHGRLDSNIAIRSMVADGSTMHCWGGGGIVADSVAAKEYAESLTKIDILLRALGEPSGLQLDN